MRRKPAPIDIFYQTFLLAAIAFISIAIATSLTSMLASAQPQNEGVIIREAIVATIRGTVDQGMKRYIQDLIDRAYRENAALILDVQSPGGFLGDTMDIADAIFNSRAPVIGYASGDSFSGATLILVPVHILAVNPTALIGDAQPVTIDQTGRLVPITEPKIVNPLVKKFTDYASQRGRNATLVAMFILNATVVNGEEAVRLRFADLTARSLGELIDRLRGVVVNTSGGSYRLEIGRVSAAGDCFSCRVLSFFSDPTVSSIMLTIGIFSAIFAISSGHLIALPVALVFIIIGLLGAGLQVDLLTMALILIGSSFIVAGFAIGHADGGILMTAGAVMVALGAALLPITGREILIAGSSGFISTVYGFSLGVGIAAATVGGIVAWQLVGIRRKRSEIFEIVGKEGVAKEDIGPGKEGYVLVEGELWRAVSKEVIRAGELIIVTGKKGFVLEVRKKIS
jgi:membrane-bound serine protease (ClpP class)